MTDLTLVVFDCDGTLADGHHLLMNALNMAYEHLEVSAPDALRVRQGIGLPLEAIIGDVTPEISTNQCAELARLCIKNLHLLRDQESYTEPLYPFVKEALRALDDIGIVMGIATGKGIRGLNHVLDFHEIAHFFTTLQTPDRAPGKPHPGMLENAMNETGARPENTVMVGDTTYDMEMAVNAGVHAIGVDWGYHEVAALRAVGARSVLTQIGDLPALLDELR